MFTAIESVRNDHAIKRILLFLIVTSVLLTTCNTGSEQQNAKITLLFTDPGNVKSASLVKNHVPASITHITIGIAGTTNTLIEEQNLTPPFESVNLSVPSGQELTITGTAYESEKAVNQGRRVVPALYAGQQVSIQFRLDEVGTIQIDVTPAQKVANGIGNVAKITADNRFILFLSEATNLIDGDTNNATDVFLKDLQDGSILNVHTDSNGNPGQGEVLDAEISADGRYVAFASDADNLVSTDKGRVSDIFVKDRTTGLVTAITQPQSETAPYAVSRSPSISDDGQWLAYTTYFPPDLQENVYLVQIGQAPIQIDSSRLPTLSGDGSMLAYVFYGEGTVFSIYDVVNNTNQSLDNVSTDSGSLALDAHGRFVLYDTQSDRAASDQNNRIDVYIQNLNIVDTQITPYFLISSDDTWQPLAGDISTTSQSVSADARFIAFELDSTVYVKSRISGALTMISQPAHRPVISPDGRKISYATEAGNLFIKENPQYRPLVQITSNNADNRYPRYSPDGSKILYHSNLNGNIDVWVMNSDGSNPVPLTESSANNQWAQWNHDGSRIVFVSDRFEVSSLFIMDADGSNPVEFASSSGGLSYPAWSPDGSRIAYVDYTNAEISGIKISNVIGAAEITVSNYAETNPSWLPTANNLYPSNTVLVYATYNVDYDLQVAVEGDGFSFTSFTAQTGNERFPVWSADGTKIAFQADTAGNQDIWIMDADGGNRIQVTTHLADDIHPHWSPDGTKLLFSSNRGGNFEIWLYDLGKIPVSPPTVIPAKPGA